MISTECPGIGSLSEFKQKTVAIFNQLQERYGYPLWMVTRTDGLDCTFLHPVDSYYGITNGYESRWLDTLCSRQVRGETANIAPDVFETPFSLLAPFAQRAKVSSYFSMELFDHNDKLFGAVMAADPEPHDPTACNALPEIQSSVCEIQELLKKSLSGYDQARKEQQQLAYQQDNATGLGDVDWWINQIKFEEQFAQYLGNKLAAAVIKVHSQSDGEILSLCKKILRSVASEETPICRTSNSEFSMIITDCSQVKIVAVSARIREEFEKHSIDANLGLARRSPAAGLEVAFQDASAACNYKSGHLIVA